MSRSPFKFFKIEQKNIPTTKQIDCEYILGKAKDIIVHRNGDEIESAIKTIHNFYRDSEHFYLQNDLPSNKKVIHTPVTIFEHFMDEFDLTTLPDFPNATWPECFALLAVALIKNACYKPLFWKDETLSKKEKESKQAEFVGDLLTEAMEAIDKANTLLEVEQEYQRGIEREKQQRRDAVNSRHDKFRELKCKFVKYFYDNKLTNQRKAAKDFYNKLPPEKRIHEGLDNAIRNLTEGLRDYRTGKLDCSDKK